MRPTIDALLAALSSAGLSAHFVAAPKDATMPYVLLWTGTGRPPVEESVAGSTVFEDDLGVTAVAALPLGVLSVQERARAALASVPADVVAGRRLSLSRYDSRPVQVDRDVTYSTGHPAYGVDMYRLVSVPA